MANGNGWVKPVLIGVAIFVLGAAIVGSGRNTIANTVDNAKQQVQVDTLKEGLVDIKQQIRDTRQEQRDDKQELLEAINRK